MKLFLKMKAAFAVALIGFGAMLFYACNEVGNGYGLNTNGDPVPAKAPDTNMALVQSIFDNAANKCSNCHGNGSGIGYNNTGGSTFGGLNLTPGNSYASLMHASFERQTDPILLRVKPGKPDSSYLYQKILATPSISMPATARMPLGGPYLSPADINVIKRWIELGAPQ